MNREELDIKIKEAKETVKSLQDERTKIDTEEIIKDLVEGEYYRIDNVELNKTILFKYTKSNFQVKDGTGTVGYDGMSYIYIDEGITWVLNRFSSETGVFYGKTFPASKINSAFGGISIKHFSKEDVEALKKEIKNDLDKI